MPKNQSPVIKQVIKPEIAKHSPVITPGKAEEEKQASEKQRQSKSPSNRSGGKIKAPSVMPKKAY